MNRILFLFVLLFLLQYSGNLKAQEIQNLSEKKLLNSEKTIQPLIELSDQETSFYCDKIVGNFLLQLDGDHLLDNLTRQIWDEPSSSWVNDSLYEHSYNGNNLVDTIIAHKWRYGTVWGNDGRWRYIYNSNNKLVQRYRGEWASTYWREYSRNNYFYSGPNQNLTQISLYLYSDNTWYLRAYTVYSWNSNNYLLTAISYTLSTIFPWTYVPWWKSEYYYDSSNVLIMKTGFSSYEGSPWTNEINDLYFYDQNGNNNENIRQEWNSNDGSWVNDYRYLYEYDIKDVLLSIVYQDWQQVSLAWENVWRETYTYTPQNQPATMLKETWTPEAGWNNYVLRTYFYDANYNWIEKITQLWDGSNWNNYYRYLATWQVPVSVIDDIPISNSFYLFNNYPNPFNPSTKIKFTISQNVITSGTKQSQYITLKVYDLLGNEISTLVNEEKQAGTYEVNFDASTLSSGMYFYTLKAGNFSETKKMILLK